MLREGLFTFWCFLVIILVHEQCSSFQCVDHYNNNVDWYVVYKLPQIKKAKGNKLIKAGVAYAFITSNNVNGWKVSDVAITHPDSIISLTLKPLYLQSEVNETLYVMYNDEPPTKKPNSNRGHTKGVVFGHANNSGTWLVHSVPKFPPKRQDGYSYPQTGTVYGQSFLCISFDFVTLNEVGRQLVYNEVEVFDYNIPPGVSELLPQIFNAANQVTIDVPPWYNMQTLTSSGGVNFTSFAKTKHFGKELYEDWIAPTLGTDLLVETWLNGQGRLPSNCSTLFSVKNLKSISIVATNNVFDSAHDHSKWCLSNDADWVCVGDINRMESQKYRGGGTVCMRDKTVQSAYKGSIVEVEECG